MLSTPDKVKTKHAELKPSRENRFIRAEMKNSASRLSAQRLSSPKTKPRRSGPHGVVYGYPPRRYPRDGLGDKGLGDTRSKSRSPSFSATNTTSTAISAGIDLVAKIPLTHEIKIGDTIKAFTLEKAKVTSSIRSPRSGFTKKQRKRGAKSPLFFLPPFGFQNKDYTTF
jgi:hypothetical protein